MTPVYVCPKTKKPLCVSGEGDELVTEDGIAYPLMNIGKGIPDFLSAYSLGDSQKINLDIYNQSFSVERYRNELNWLYATFGEDESSFRRQNLEKLEIRRGQSILVTGCGLGSDIRPIAEAVGIEGAVYAQDLAPEMVLYTANCAESFPFDVGNIYLSVSDAQNLPFADGFFDGVFHFGGINLFDNIRLSIYEMARVTKKGGRVVFGDESVGPWLRDTDYGRAAIYNNTLWKVGTPIDLLPENATDVNLSWVFGNCFYLICFQVSADGPYMNMDVPHKGPRGGSMRSRYYGQLEGVSAASKRNVIDDAKKRQISVFQWLEEAIQEKSGKPTE
jgi:ubiquinone/menaquinone biosynthesis C-methylase UbiE